MQTPDAADSSTFVIKLWHTRASETRQYLRPSFVS
jgi:hypothetical protein